MADAGQPTTFAELKTDLQKRVKGDSSSDTVTKLGRYINIGLLAMHLGNWEKFSWAERRAVLVLQPSYNTGRIELAQGAAAVTEASTSSPSVTEWDTANTATGVKNARTGGKFVINGGKDVYEVLFNFSAANAVGSWNYTFEPPRGIDGWDAACEGEFDGSSGFLNCFSEDEVANGVFNLGFLEVRWDTTPGNSVDIVYDGGHFSDTPDFMQDGELGNTDGSTMASFMAVPEPSLLALLGVVSGVVLLRRRA